VTGSSPAVDAGAAPNDASLEMEITLPVGDAGAFNCTTLATYGPSLSDSTKTRRATIIGLKLDATCSSYPYLFGATGSGL
jgi:hypothetical protein